jgi:hypothetical protein
MSLPNDARWERRPVLVSQLMSVPYNKSEVEACTLCASDWTGTGTVAKYAAVPTPFPPILVEGKTMRIRDGRHRLAAAVLRGDRFIACNLS